jgi:hypothetical protein
MTKTAELSSRENVVGLIPLFLSAARALHNKASEVTKNSKVLSKDIF